MSPARPRRATRALWPCPRCGRRFAHANQWHSCERASLEAHFARSSPEIVAVFRAIESALRRIGAVSIEPVKTMILIKTRRVLAVARLLRERLDLALVVTRRLESSRFIASKTLSRRLYEHKLRLRSPREVDAELRAWLREAFDGSLAQPRARDEDDDRDDRPFGGGPSMRA